MSTYASMYLRQQLLSVFPVNTLQFHPVASSSVQCAVNKTGTYLTAGLLFPLLLALREVLLSEGNGQSAVPMLELATRQQGLKAHLLLREHLLLRREPAAQPELDFPRQACRSKTCWERLLQRNKPWGLLEQTAPQHSWR